MSTRHSLYNWEGFRKKGSKHGLLLMLINRKVPHSKLSFETIEFVQMFIPIHPFDTQMLVKLKARFLFRSFVPGCLYNLQEGSRVIHSPFRVIANSDRGNLNCCISNRVKVAFVITLSAFHSNTAWGVLFVGSLCPAVVGHGVSGTLGHCDANVGNQRLFEEVWKLIWTPSFLPWYIFVDDKLQRVMKFEDEYFLDKLNIKRNAQVETTIEEV